RTVTIERVIDDRTFEQLFVGIGVLPAFRRALCNDMGRTVDSAAAHVISHVWPDFDQGVWGRCVCLVPADEADKDFGTWLRLLDRPIGAAEPRLPADAEPGTAPDPARGEPPPRG